jgi:Protein of unknown function (DUF3185)
MAIMRNVGVVLVAIGIVFLIVGIASIATPVEKFMQALSGHYSSQTVLYIAAGFAALAAGGLIVSTRTD